VISESLEGSPCQRQAQTARFTRKGLQSKRATASLLIKRNQLVLIQSVWLVESRAVEFYGVGLVCQGCLIVIAPH